MAQLSKEEKLMHDIEEIKERIDIPRAWELLGLAGSPKKRGAFRSPFRDERRPSFSIFNDGKMWKDHGNGESGSVIDFWCKATGCDEGAAIKELAKLAGVSNQDHTVLPMKKFAKLGPRSQAVIENCEAAHVIDPEMAAAELRWTLQNMKSDFDAWLKKKRISENTILNLCRERSIGENSRGQLCFFFEAGTKIRRVLNDSHSSIWTEGSSASLPWRIRRVDDQRVHTVYIAEGESDLMRSAPMLQQIPLDRDEDNGTACIISMPSASWRPEAALAWRIGAYRNVVLLMDEDKAGRLCRDALTEIFSKEAKGCKLWRPEFPEGADCCDLTDDKLLKAFDRMKRIN